HHSRSISARVSTNGPAASSHGACENPASGAPCLSALLVAYSWRPVGGIRERTIRPMPTLFRFLFILAVIAGVIYGSMVALVVLVEPRERDVTVRIPSERLNPPPRP